MSRPDQAIIQLQAQGDRVRLLQITDTHLCAEPGGTLLDMDTDRSLQLVISQALGAPEVLANVDRKPAYPAVVVRFLTERDKERVHGHPGDEQLAAARAVPGVIAVHWHLQPGDPLPALEHSGARFAAVIAAGDTRENTHASADKALELLLSRPSP